MTDFEFCSNIRSITNILPLHAHNLVGNMVDIIIHEIACQCSEYTDGKLEELEFDLPYIGHMKANIVDGVVCDIKVTPNDALQEKLNKAVSEFESPLIEKSINIVGNKMLEKYKSLL